MLNSTKNKKESVKSRFLSGKAKRLMLKTKFLALLIAGMAFMGNAQTIITIGDTTILPTGDCCNGNLLVSQSAVLTQPAAIQSLSFYVVTAAGQLRLGIYDATGPGAGPGAKLAETAEFTPVAGWNTAYVITPVSLAAGTYWLAYLPSSNTLSFRNASDASSSGKYYTYAYAAMPSVFSTTPNTTPSHWSFYATLNVGPPDTVAPSSPTGLNATAGCVTSINLSWSESTDNTGIARYEVERCQGAGCSGFTQIATTTATSYFDGGLTPSTDYTYRVRAIDMGANPSGYSAISNATTGSQAMAYSDFQARCSAPGVVKCVGFDNTAIDIVQGVNLDPAWDGVYRGGLDTSTKASGNGSLRFTLPDTVTGANISGGWREPLGGDFGENSTFYVQFRQRFSPEMFSNFSTWNSYWKQVLFYGQTATCQQVELTTTTYYDTGIPNMYTDCGGRSMRTDLGGSSYQATVPFLLQQGTSPTDGYNCQYGAGYPAGNGNGAGCFYNTPNKWITYYYKIHVGTWGQANSTIQAWVATDCQPYKQWINVLNMELYSGGDVYDRILFTPYMTGLSTFGTATAYTWYDELIVSTQPIAAPGSSVTTGQQESATAENNLAVYPNPFSTSTTLDFSSIKKSAADNLSFYVYNLLGEQVAAYDNVSGNQLVIEKSSLGGAKGMYFYKATLNGENSGMGKLVVE